jgi:beta-lactamase class A
MFNVTERIDRMGMTGSFQGHYRFERFVLDHRSPVDAPFQEALERIDQRLRALHGMATEHTAVGVLDLLSLRLAMVRPDRMEYAASVAKVAILLAYFQLHPEAATDLTETTAHELGLMIKASSNEMATKFSRQLGLAPIQRVLNSYGFYDPNQGGLWMGKHYGDDSERFGDPRGDNSHAATVRQLLRFYLLLEQGHLVSPPASARMRALFDSPRIAHDRIKFVKGLEGRPRQIRRKWGSWEDWCHDSAVVSGPGRNYIIVGLTHHPRGDEYLQDLAVAVDDAV